MDEINLKAFYRSDGRFRQYVQSYARKHKILIDEALTHEIVKQVAEFYFQTKKPD